MEIRSTNKNAVSPVPTFPVIGMLGLIVNTLALVIIHSHLNVPLPLASLVASEVAVLHNYVLHYGWSFDRKQIRWRSLLVFHAIALGTFSLTVVFLLWMTRLSTIDYPVLNVVAVLTASVLNYALIARWAWSELPLRDRPALQLPGLRRQPQTRPQLPEPEPIPVVEAESEPSLAAFITKILTRSKAAVNESNAVVVRRLMVCVGVLASAVLAYQIITANEGFWLTLATLVVSVLLFVRPGVSREQMVSHILTCLVAASASVYLIWRTSSISRIYWPMGLLLFAAEAFGTLHLLGFYYTLWPRAEIKLNLHDDPGQFPVFIFVPTVNEGPGVLRPTIQGALETRDKYLETYPNGKVTIILCNDGFVAGNPNYREVEELARQMGVESITRQVKGGAKAGNIENARQAFGATNDALLAIFDADQIPEPEFLVKMVAPFADPQVGWVQSGQYYRNTSFPVALWSNDQQAMFYKLLCPGKAPLNSVIICGTNVVVRAKAFDEIGGLPQDSVTEDIAASLELHPRWLSVYLPDKLATGLGPVDLHSYFSQQRRWAIGNLSLGRDRWRDILLPGKDGLSRDQRIQYLLACTHYLCGIRDVVYIITPIAFLLFSISAIDFTSFPTFLSHAIPFWVLSQAAFWMAAKRKTGLRGVMLNFATFPVYIQAVFTVITGRRVGFQVTSKQRTSTNSLRYIRPHLFFLGLSLVSIVIGLSHLASNPGPIAMSLFWVTYQTIYLSGVTWLAITDLRAQGMPIFQRRSGVVSYDNSQPLA